MKLYIIIINRHPFCRKYLWFFIFYFFKSSNKGVIQFQSCTSNGVYVPLYLLVCQVRVTVGDQASLRCLLLNLTSFECELTPLECWCCFRCFFCFLFLLCFSFRRRCHEISAVGYVTELFRWRILQLNENAVSGQVKPPPQEPDHGWTSSK